MITDFASSVSLSALGCQLCLADARFRAHPSAIGAAILKRSKDDLSQLNRLVLLQIDKTLIRRRAVISVASQPSRFERLTNNIAGSSSGSN